MLFSLFGVYGLCESVKSRDKIVTKWVSVKDISRFLPSTKVKDPTADSELVERPELPRLGRLIAEAVTADDGDGRARVHECVGRLGWIVIVYAAACRIPAV